MFPDTLRGKTPSFDYDFTRNFNLTYRLVRCRQCTHVYASPRPADMWSKYTGDKPDAVYLENSEQRLATGRAVVESLRKYKPGGRLLDVGCATGDFLSAAAERYQPEGLELSEWSGRRATAKGFLVHKKLLGELAAPEAYDIVTLWGVIEHFEQPKAEVLNIHRLLKKDGIACLWTGDVDSLLAGLLGKKWWYYQGQHIQMFTRRSLRLLFESAGFTTELMGYYPYRFTPKSVNNTLSRYPLVSMLTRPLLSSKALGNLGLTLKLSGEMFAVFRKK